MRLSMRVVHVGHIRWICCFERMWYMRGLMSQHKMKVIDGILHREVERGMGCSWEYIPMDKEFQDAYDEYIAEKELLG